MSKIYGKIIIVEGVWGSGKTTLIKVLKKSLNQKVVCINEPNHLLGGKKGSAVEVTNWYKAAHYKNISKAIILAKKNNLVLVERSPLSSIIFASVYLKKTQDYVKKEVLRLEKRLREIEKINKERVYIVYLSNMKRALPILKSKRYLRHLADKNLVSRISKEIKKWLLEIDRSGVIKLLVDPEIKTLIKNL